MSRLYFSRRLKGVVDRSPLVDRGMRWLEAAMLETVMGATRRLGVERASDWGAWFGRQIGARTRKNRHVLDNLRVIFPEAEQGWIERQAIGVWEQIGRVAGEYPHLPSFADSGRIELVSKLDLEELRRSGRGVVFVAMHQANWNLFSLGGHLGGFPLAVVNRRQINPRIEALVAQFRDKMPCEILDVTTVPRKMVEALNKGRSVGLFIDHRIDDGEPIPFCGHPAYTTTVPARIAAKLGTALVPARLERLPGVRFRLTLEEPIRADPAQSDHRLAAIEMTTRVHRIFETWVRAVPTDWCCVKRRWDKNVPDRVRTRNDGMPREEPAPVPAG